MHVRDADPARDGGACAAIYRPAVTDGVASFESEAPSAAEMAARIAAVTARRPWLVAEDDAGQVIGYAYASAHRERAAYRWSVEVTVYVDARHHRRGVARALYEPLLALLAAQGFRIALAGITLPNPASVGLHEALGFTPVGVYRGVGFKAGAWHDVGWWQKPLAGPAEDGPPAEPLAPVRLPEP
jgi:phosphinothricin acetyltransferase